MAVAADVAGKACDVGVGKRGITGAECDICCG